MAGGMGGMAPTYGAGHLAAGGIAGGMAGIAGGYGVYG